MSLSVGQLLDDLEEIGVRIWVEDGQLRFRAPRGAMSDDRRALLRARKQEIVEHLNAGGFPRLEPDARTRHEPFPLTDVQSAYLLGRGSAFAYGGVACHGYGELRYGELDPHRMTDAWRALIARHDMLRAVVSADGSQRVLAEVPDFAPRVTYADDPEQFRHAVEATRAEMDHRIFPTDRWPLFDCRLTLGPGAAVLHLSIDFLIADFVSIQVILNELHLLYHRPGTRLPELEITFRDYLLAERAWVSGARRDADMAYWLARVDKLPPAPELPMAGHPPGGSGRFRRWVATMPAELWDRLRERASRADLSPSSAVLAAYADVIAAWSRRPRFTLNVTLLNRVPLHPQVPSLVGDFTGVELLAVDATGATFADLARAVQRQLWQDLDHRTFSGIEVMHEITRSGSAESALFPVVFTSAIGFGGGDRPGDVALGDLGYGISQTPQVIIDCQNMERAGALVTNWDVREGVFPDGMVDDMFGAYRELLWDLASGDARWTATGRVPLPMAQARCRARVNATAAVLPAGRLHDEVFQQARRAPDRPAVIHNAKVITYRELTAHAAGVAERLAQAGCGGGDLVAITLERGWRQVSAVLGTLLTDAAYVPVDPSSPPARQSAILASSGAGYRLASSSTLSALGAGPEPIVVDDIAPAAEVARTSGSRPQELAYVIHTSGSTGTPKGVMITHRAAQNTVVDINRRFGVTAGDGVLALSALGFDLSVYDIFGPLSVGGRLIIPDHGRRADPSHWAQLLAEHRVTIWNSVPAQLQMLADYLATSGAPAVHTVRLAMLSGDWIPVALPDQIRRGLPEARLVSLGGATEASIWSIHHPIETVDPAWSSIPYGTPLANQTFHVLDDALRPCPDWVTGELYIGGAGLALGYLNDPDRTGERFIEHPVTGERLYRTGDLGRYRPGGTIEFLGRDDFQVKIRGHRVELAEVETALAAHPDVGGSAALAVGDPRHDRRLVGFAEPARITPDTADTATLAAATVSAADAALADVDRDRYRAFADRLDGVALSAMLQTLRSGGLFARAGDGHELPEILDRAGVAPRHHRLVRRWLRALVAEGLLAVHNGRFSPRDRGPAVDAAWASVEAIALPADRTLLDYFRASIDALAALLHGDTDPLRLLFPGGRVDVSQSLYEYAVFNRWANRAVATAVGHLASSHPGPLRVLEVGAGAGGTTKAVLRALPEGEFEYLSTDLSPYFVNESRSRFADVAGIRFAVCDLNEDLLPQGIAANGADVIVAGDVLHATTDIDAVLRRLREVLAPGGWIVAAEMTRDHYQIMTSLELLVSVDPATGDFLDERRGTDTVFLDRLAWSRAVTRAGASAQVLLPEPGTFIDDLGMCVLAARFKADRARIRPGELAAHLRDRLPEHMVPPAIHVLDALPVTENGKIDRKALAARLPSGDAPAIAAATAVTSDLERRLETLWVDALKVPVGRDGNFFQLGGDSLVAAQLAGHIAEQVPEAGGVFFDEVLRSLLDRPTVGELAEWLARRPRSEPAPAAPDRRDRADLLTRVRDGSAGVPLVLVPGPGDSEDAAAGMVELALAIDPAAPTWSLLESVYALLPHLDRLAADAAAAIIDADLVQVRLVGGGLTALVAVEVARSLIERGVLVEDVVLIAPHWPSRPDPGASALHNAVAAAEPPIYAGDLVIVRPAGRDAERVWEDICLGDVRAVESAAAARRS